MPTINNSAKALYSIGDYQNAINDYTQVIQLDPYYAPAYLGRADASAELNDAESPIADYTKAIEIDSSNPYTYNNRAILLYEQRDWDGAIADLEKAVQLFLAQGRNYEYNVAVDNLEKAQRTRSRPNDSDPNMMLLKSWGLNAVTCSEQTVLILIDNKEYCTLPSSWLDLGKYRYIRSEDRLESLL